MIFVCLTIIVVTFLICRTISYGMRLFAEHDSEKERLQRQNGELKRHLLTIVQRLNTEMAYHPEISSLRSLRDEAWEKHLA